MVIENQTRCIFNRSYNKHLNTLDAHYTFDSPRLIQLVAIKNELLLFI